MPIHEYDCASCDAVFEELVRGSEGAVACPQCGGSKVRRRISSFAFKSAGAVTSNRSSAGGGSCASCRSSRRSCGSCGR